MGLQGNRSDTAVQGPGSNWAWDPHRQGGNQHTVVVPLVAWVLLLVALGRMVPGLLAGSIAWRVVAPAVLPAMLAHMLVAIGVRPRRGDKGNEGHRSWSGSLTRKYADTPPQPA